MAPVFASEKSFLAAVAVLAASALLPNMPIVEGAAIPQHHELTHGSRCVVLRDALPSDEFGPQYTLALGSCDSKDAVQFKYNSAEHQLESNIDGLCLSTLEPDNHAVGLASCHAKKHAGDPEGKKWEVTSGGAWRNYNCLCLHHNDTMLIQDDCAEASDVLAEETDPVEGGNLKGKQHGSALSSGLQWELLPENPCESSMSGCAAQPPVLTPIAYPDMPQQTPVLHLPEKPEEIKEPHATPFPYPKPPQQTPEIKPQDPKPSKKHHHEKIKEPQATPYPYPKAPQETPELPKHPHEPEPERPYPTPIATPMITPNGIPVATPVATPYKTPTLQPEKPVVPQATPTATPYPWPKAPQEVPQLPQKELEVPQATPTATPYPWPKAPQEVPQLPQKEPEVPYPTPIATPHITPNAIPQATPVAIPQKVPQLTIPQAIPTATPYISPNMPQQIPSLPQQPQQPQVPEVPQASSGNACAAIGGWCGKNAGAACPSYCRNGCQNAHSGAMNRACPGSSQCFVCKA